MVKRFALILTEEQLEVLARACDLFSRVGMGQFDEVANHLQGPAFPNLPNKLQLIKDMFNEISQFAMAVDGYRFYGIASPEVAEQHKISCDIYQTIRHKLAWMRQPLGGMQVRFDEPFRVSNQPLPEIEEE